MNVELDHSQIQQIVATLDTKHPSEQQSAWLLLRPLGSRVVPYLAESYPRVREPQARGDLVYHCLPYARQSQTAFEVGLMALHDDSYLVRYRACSLLAYSLRPDAVAELGRLLQHSDPRSVRDAQAAIDAIRSQNHHLFLDRDHSGRSRWFVTDWDYGNDPA